MDFIAASSLAGGRGEQLVSLTPVDPWRFLPTPPSWNLSSGADEKLTPVE